MPIVISAGSTPPDIKPKDMAELRNDLYDWYLGPRGYEYVEAFILDIATRREALPEPIAKESAPKRIEWFIEDEVKTLVEGELYWVADNMCALAEKAGETYDAKFLREDLPADSGFMYLQRPFWMYSRDGVKASIQGVTWHLGGKAMVAGVPGDYLSRSGITVSVYSNSFLDVRESGPDDPLRALFERAKKRGDYMDWFSMYHSSFFPWGTDLDEMVKAVSNTDSLGARPGTDEQEERAKRSVVDFYRFLFSMWTLMKQSIPGKHLVQHDRPTRRRLARKGLPSEVFFITLRKVDYGERERNEDPDHVEWSHRWLVQGHWRKIHKGTDRERVVWVRPHEKGPADKPLVIKERISVVRR